MYERFLNCGDPYNDSDAKILQLRKMVLAYGITPALRGIIWKLLLGVETIDSKTYLTLVKSGPSNKDDKIKDDANRTFGSDNENFWSRVKEDQIIRVLNAFATSKSKETNIDINDKDNHQVCGYVQGMNVLLGILLYVMPELDAFTAFSCLCNKHFPRYLYMNLDGPHHGCELFEKCLQILDFDLYKHLKKRLDSKIYAFSKIMTLLACMKPFDEVLKLWDAIFAFGLHLHIILLCVHIISVRELILQETNAYQMHKIIADLPLDSEMLIKGALKLIIMIPPSLYEELVLHYLSP
jgi:cell cycle arrest protein BUB2